MPENVGGMIAASHARKLDCPMCGSDCQPVIIDRSTRSGDHFERLRCALGQTFRRIWIGGYR